MWILESTDTERTLTFRLLPGSLKTMGRAAGVDFVVDAALVSRVHCRLTLHQGDRLEVEDLGSTNGTFVNDRKVDRAALQTGDRLKVGRVEFLIKSVISDH
jgi:pSer/pThr/pTyr-binding forkhead associated (FHA) protein